MTTTAYPGPLSIEGAKPAMLGPTPQNGGQAAIVDSNPDLAPSLIYGGIGIRDPRWLQRIGAGPLSAGGYANQDVGWYMSAGGLVVCDQVPSTLSTTNLAAAQTVASGVAMTLANASTGINVLSSALSLPVPIGATIPAGARVIDGNPTYVGGGTSGAFAFLNPAVGVCRAIAVTAAAAATGGVIALVGYDWYGNLIHENVTAVASTTVNSVKCFKFLISATPAFTDGSHNYSLGTSDVFGFNVRASNFAYTRIIWNDNVITASTGMTAGVSTTATATTGDTRGRYNVQSASDGSKRLVMFVMPSVANMVVSNIPNAIIGLTGVSQF